MEAVRDISAGMMLEGTRVKDVIHPALVKAAHELAPDIERLVTAGTLTDAQRVTGLETMLQRRLGEAEVITEAGVEVGIDVRAEVTAEEVMDKTLEFKAVILEAEKNLKYIRAAMQEAKQDSVVVLANTIDVNNANSFKKFAAICSAANKPVVVAGVKADGVEGMISRMDGVRYIDVTDDRNPAGTVYNEMEKYRGTITVVMKDTESYGGRFAVNDPLFNIIVTGKNAKFGQVLTAYVASIATGKGANYVTFTDEAINKLKALKKEVQGKGGAASTVMIERTHSEETDDAIDEALLADFEADIAF